MKSIKKIAMLIGLGLIIHPQTWGQVGNKATVQSAGGGGGTTIGTTGAQNGLELQHFGVAGEQIVASPLSGGAVEMHVGFMYAQDDDLGAPIECDPPLGLTATVSAPDIIIDWNDNGVFDYELRYRPQGNPDWIFVNSTGGLNSYTLNIETDNLFDGTVYQYQVRGICEDGSDIKSIFSPTETFETPGAPECNIPTVFNEPDVITNGPGTVILSWETTDADSYDIRYRITGSTAWTTVNTGDGAPAAALTGLADGMPYQYRVKSICSGINLESPFSDIQTFTTQGLPECEIPEAFVFSNVTEDAADIDWTGPVDADFDVRYRVKGTSLWTLNTVSTPVVSLSGLLPGTIYQVNARSICDEENGLQSQYSDVVEFETLGQTFCDVPDNFTISNIGETGATLDWDQAAGALLYDVRYRVQGTSVWTEEVSLGTQFVFSGLQSGMPYQVRVRSVCDPESGLQSVFSDVLVFETIGLPACDIPVNLAATAITNSSADLSWDVASGALEYQVRYRVKGTALWTSLVTDQTTLPLSGLVSGTPYQYTVKSLCSNDGTLSSQFASTEEFTTTGDPVCDVPTDFTISNLLETSATIDWTGTSEAETYIFRYRVQGTTIWTEVEISAPTIDLTGLLSGTSYQFRAKSICEADGSLSSEFSATLAFDTPGTVSCAVPSGFSVTALDQSTADIDWEDAEGAMEYQFRYRIQGTTLWISQNVTSSNISLSGLESGMPYQFQAKTICAEDGTVASTFSSSLTFTTLGLPTCEIPEAFLVSNITENSADLTWEVADGAQGYEVRYRVTGTTIWTTETTTTNNISLTGLVTGMPYQYRVKTLCSEDGSLESQFADTQTFTVAGQPACDVPSGFTVSNISSDGATLDWSDATGAVSYEYRYRVKGTSSWLTGSSTIASIEFTGLFMGTEYQYQVRSVCDGSGILKSQYSATQSFVTGGDIFCSEPTNITITGIGDEVATVNWDAIPSAVRYEVRYRVKGTSIWIKEFPATNQLNLIGLATGTIYQVRIKSICAEDGSVVSGLTGITQFETTGPEACAVPENLVVNETTSDGADLGWDIANGAMSYDVQYRSVGESVWTTVNTPSNTIVLTGLVGDEEYQWRVRTVCSEDNTLRSVFSPSSTFSTVPDGGFNAARVGTDTSEDDLTLELSQPLFSDISVMTYPNPFSDRVTIAFNLHKESKISLKVFDLSGIEVANLYEGQIEAYVQYEFELDASHLGDGVYLYRMTSDAGDSYVQRIILQR